MFNYSKLDECIKKSGKTRTYLCSKLGRPAYYLRDVIRQRNTIPDDYQQILADELGVTVEYLNDIEHKDAKKEPTNDSELDALREEVVDLIMGMSKSQLKKFLETAKALKNAKVFD